MARFRNERQLHLYTFVVFSTTTICVGRGGREGCSSTGNRVELRSNEWISPTRFRAQWKLTPMCGGRGGEGGEEMEVEEIGSVTRLTGSICIRFDPLDELFIALRRAFAVSPRPPPLLPLFLGSLYAR